MGGFDENFQSLVKLKKDALGLEANQQQFNQNESFFRREGDLHAQRLNNSRSQLELDRAKGFMPIDMANARMGLQNTINDMSDQQDERGFNEQMHRLTLENRANEQIRVGADYNYQAGRQRLVDSQKDADYGYQTGRKSQMDNQQNADYNYRFDRQRMTDARQDSDYGYQTGRQRIMDTRQDADYGYQRKLNDMDMSDRMAAAQARLSNANNPAIRAFADGGPVQDAQAKGFMPVRVSNGEYEFTPEQVANIGASMLASQNQGATPVGLDSMS